jgi:hypothetical protein
MAAALPSGSVYACSSRVGILTLVSMCSPHVDARQAVGRPQPSHITILPRKRGKPADLGFEGGSEIDKAGTRCMSVSTILTTSDFAPQTCLITTNRYEQDLQKETSTRCRREGPAGECGVVDVFTLQDEATGDDGDAENRAGRTRPRALRLMNNRRRSVGRASVEHFLRSSSPEVGSVEPASDS